MAEGGGEETLIQIITVTEDQCGYCLESGTRRVDPRRLPCGHSFCLLCLTDDFARINAVRCPVCRFVHIMTQCNYYKVLIHRSFPAKIRSMLGSYVGRSSSLRPSGISSNLG